jgi:hypothetical protein
LRDQGQDKARDERAQVARGRQDKQAAGAAARQDHAHTEHQAADDRARQAAGAGQLTASETCSRPVMISAWVEASAVMRTR